MKKLRSVKAVLMQEFPEKSQAEIEEMMQQLSDVEGKQKEFFIKSNGENITKIGVRFKDDDGTKCQFYFTTKHYDESMD